MTNAQAEFPTEARSSSCYMDSKKIVRATVNATYTGQVVFYLSCDGGANYEEITVGEIHNFTNTGGDLRWSAIGIAPATLFLLTIEYEVEQT
jgi:hypothetical protein